MRSARSILSVQFTPIGGPTSVRRAVGGFLRYIQQNDHKWVAENPGGVDGFLRYAAHRDRTMPQGRLLTAKGDAGDRDRHEVGRFVTRSVEGRTKGRAYYRLIISPEDARGMDLRKVTRQVMAQLERDAGPDGLPPWIGAEHRNTAHPHVHVVMAAHRQLIDGRYRALVINRERLARMKISMSREIYRQRSPERELDDRKRQLEMNAQSDNRLRWLLTTDSSRAHDTSDSHMSHPRFRHRLSPSVSLRFAIKRVAGHYRRRMDQELERLEHERKLQNVRSRGGRER